MSTRTDLEALGKRILNEARTELYLDMPFMGAALNALGYRMDLSTRTVGTDAADILFNPRYLTELYLNAPAQLNRAYLHMLLHCLFRHMFRALPALPTSPSAAAPSTFPSAEYEYAAALWNLSTDIAVEAVIDSMEYPSIRRVSAEFRDGWITDLTDALEVLTAERIYRYLAEHPVDGEEFERLSRAFAADDHSFWERLRTPEKDAPPETSAPPAAPELQQRNDEWKKNAKQTEAALRLSGKEASDEVGSLDRLLHVTARSRTDYRKWLERFAVTREEARIDPDTFDFGLYHYGMTLYGNMPLIEENEFREEKKVETLALVIDTSASCQDTLVQRFLNETASILRRQERFFHRAEIHIIECDDQVQSDLTITNPEEMARYAEGFHIRGGYGTDFRPAFAYIDDLQRRGALKSLRGLLYFTDGLGIYPTRPTKYETAFVFWNGDTFDDTRVPSWAYKLYMEA